MMQVLKNSPLVVHVVLVLVVCGGEEEDTGREGTETVVVEEMADDSETVEDSESSK